MLFFLRFACSPTGGTIVLNGGDGDRDYFSHHARLGGGGGQTLINTTNNDDDDDDDDDDNNNNNNNNNQTIHPPIRPLRPRTGVVLS